MGLHGESQGGMGDEVLHQCHSVILSLGEWDGSHLTSLQGMTLT